MWLSACLYYTHVWCLWWLEEGIKSFGTGGTNSCELPCGWLKLNSPPLEEQVHSTAEQSTQPSSSWFNSPAENRHHSCQIVWSFVLHACFIGNLFQIHLSSCPERKNVCMFSHTVFSHFLFQLFFIDQSQQWTNMYFSTLQTFFFIRELPTKQVPL